MNTEPQRERRRWARTQTNVSGRLSFLVDREPSECDCEILNIASGGALIKVLNATGIPDEFCLVIDNNEDRTIICKTSRRHRDHVGAVFLDPLPDSLVQALATNGSEPPQPEGFYTWQKRHVEMRDIRRARDVEMTISPEMARNGMKFLQDSSLITLTERLHDEFIYELLHACLSKQKLDLKFRMPVRWPEAMQVGCCLHKSEVSACDR